MNYYHCKDLKNIFELFEKNQMKAAKDLVKVIQKRVQGECGRTNVIEDWSLAVLNFSSIFKVLLIKTLLRIDVEGHQCNNLMAILSIYNSLPCKQEFVREENKEYSGCAMWIKIFLVSIHLLSWESTLTTSLKGLCNLRDINLKYNGLFSTSQAATIQTLQCVIKL